jgi:hypothetical protein
MLLGRHMHACFSISTALTNHCRCHIQHHMLADSTRAPGNLGPRLKTLQQAQWGGGASGTPMSQAALYQAIDVMASWQQQMQYERTNHAPFGAAAPGCAWQRSTPVCLYIHMRFHACPSGISKVPDNGLCSATACLGIQQLLQQCRSSGRLALSAAETRRVLRHETGRSSTRTHTIDGNKAC